MSQSSDVFARTGRFVPYCAAALLLAACGADSGSLPAMDATTSQQQGTTVVRARPAPTTCSPQEAISSGDLGIIVPPCEDGSLPGDLWVGCKYAPKFQVSDLEAIVPLAEADPGGVAQAIEPFLSGGEGQFWPQAGWLILRETEDEVLLVHHDAGGLSFMNVRRVDGAWQWSGSQSGGSCPLYYRVPDSFNAVDWRLDPEAPPDPRGMTLGVLVTERQCVSGQEVGERLRGPQVVMTDDVVRIAFAAEPPPGDSFNCPSNPETPVIVALPAPLGEREIVEGLAIGIDLEDFLPAP